MGAEQSVAPADTLYPAEWRESVQSDEASPPSSPAGRYKSFWDSDDPIRAVAKMSPSEFLRVSAPLPELDASGWKLDDFSGYAAAALLADPQLRKFVDSMVQKRIKEDEFWRLYFCHVYKVVKVGRARGFSCHISEDICDGTAEDHHVAVVSRLLGSSVTRSECLDTGVVSHALEHDEPAVCSVHASNGAPPVSIGDHCDTGANGCAVHTDDKANLKTSHKDHNPAWNSITGVVASSVAVEQPKLSDEGSDFAKQPGAYGYQQSDLTSCSLEQSPSVPESGTTPQPSDIMNEPQSDTPAMVLQDTSSCALANQEEPGTSDSELPCRAVFAALHEDPVFIYLVKQEVAGDHGANSADGFQRGCSHLTDRLLSVSKDTSGGLSEAPADDQIRSLLKRQLGRLAISLELLETGGVAASRAITYIFGADRSFQTLAKSEAESIQEQRSEMDEHDEAADIDALSTDRAAQCMIEPALERLRKSPSTSQSEVIAALKAELATLAYRAFASRLAKRIGKKP